MCLRLQAFVDVRDFFYPPAPFGVLEIRNLLDSPMKVVGKEGYLPIKLIQGVAYDPPAASRATSNSWAHFGHSASMLAFPSRLMRL